MTTDNVRILAVDDRQENLTAVVAILGASCTIVTANSGTAALQFIMQEEFALILLDVQMPVMDGFKIAASLRQSGKNADTPIIFLTAYDNAVAQSKGYSLGAVDYIIKPIDPGLLKAKVEVFVDLNKKRNIIEAREKELLEANLQLAASNLKYQELLHKLEVHRLELKAQNEELLQARGEAEAALTSLRIALQEAESFSYSVSHDLRSPLRAINGYLSILQEDFKDFLPLEAQPILDCTRAASATMGKLIDDLLDLARAIRSEPAKKTVDLSKLVLLIVANLQEAEPARDVTIEAAKGITARGDSALLNQVLVNLISNAWKYSSRKKKLCLEFGEKVVGRERVFFVKDNGIGFDMRYHDQIYGVFQRLHRNEYDGNGIGLATVKRIVERHGGKVWAEGEPDKGACFFFTLSTD